MKRDGDDGRMKVIIENKVIMEDEKVMMEDEKVIREGKHLFHAN